MEQQQQSQEQRLKKKSSHAQITPDGNDISPVPQNQPNTNTHTENNIQETQNNQQQQQQIDIEKQLSPKQNTQNIIDYNDFDIKSKNVIQLSSYKNREEKEKAMFPYRNQDLVKECIPDPTRGTSGCCCCKKPLAPKEHPEAYFKESLDPNFQLKKAVIIYNPYSGNGRGGKTFPIIEKCLKQANIEIIKVLTTQKAKHAIELAENAPEIEQADAVFCTGGDGTLNEIVNGMMLRQKKTGKPHPYIAYVPGGTANDMGQTLYGLKNRYNVEYVMNKLIKGKPYGMDLLQITYHHKEKKQEVTEYAHLMAAWGLGVAANVTAEKIRCCGPFRYDVGIFWEILKGGIKDVHIEINGNGKVFNVKTHLMMIVNNKYVGDKLRFMPFGIIDDGLLEFACFENQGKCETLKCFDELKRNGAHIYHPAVIYGQVQKIKFWTKEPTMIQLDGENDRHQETPVTIECLNKQMRIIY